MKRILVGPHAVSEALRSAPGSIEMVCVAENLRPMAVLRIEEQAKHARVTCEMLPKTALDGLAKGIQHQGVIAITGTYPYLDLEGLLHAAAKQQNPLLVVLDQVQDPRNLGAIMRSAHAFGAAGLILTRNKSAGVTVAAVRTSVGASERLRVARVINLAHTLDQIRQSGYQVFGASVAPSAPRLEAVSWKGPTALVLGNEGKGLRRLTAEHCDQLFTIPLVSDFDSLNVSAAAAIALYEASKQRYPSQ